MNSEPKQPKRVPTLTEVISDLPAPAPMAAPPLPPRGDAEVASEPLLAAALVQEARIAERVIARLQPRLEALFEHRLREALARLHAALADEARKEMSRALREAVQQAVSEEAARHRSA